MKRRVSNGRFYREPSLLRMGKLEIAEYGLGAAYRKHFV